MMPSATPRMFLTAAPPRSTSTSGESSSICRARNGAPRPPPPAGRRGGGGGRPQINGVGDVDVFLGKPDRGEHAVEQLPRASDEGLALQILVAAWRFPDQHDAGVLASPREAQALRRALERAAFETCHQSLEFGESGSLTDAHYALAACCGGGAAWRPAGARGGWGGGG